MPFRVTIRALDAAGNPLTEFTGVAELAASGALLHGAGPTPAFINGVLADLLVTIEEPGQHPLNATLPGGDAETLSDSFRVTDSYQRWLLTQFPNPEDRENPLLSGPEADPWGTGVGNLLAYAIGTDPRDPDRSRLPQPTLHTLGDSSGSGPTIAAAGEQHLAITYARDKGAADVIFIPEVSDDLITWHAGPAFTEEVAAQDHGHYELVTARDLAPLSDGGRRFMRRRVRSGERLASWQARHFTGDQFLDPDWSSSTASPAGDNISNLMKCRSRP